MVNQAIMSWWFIHAFPAGFFVGDAMFFFHKTLAGLALLRPLGCAFQEVRRWCRAVTDTTVTRWLADTAHIFDDGFGVARFRPLSKEVHNLEYGIKGYWPRAAAMDWSQHQHPLRAENTKHHLIQRVPTVPQDTFWRTLQSRASLFSRDKTPFSRDKTPSRA